MFEILTPAQIDKMALGDVKKYIGIYRMELKARQEELMKYKEDYVSSGIEYIYKNLEATQYVDTELMVARTQLKNLAKALQSQRTTVTGLAKIHQAKITKARNWLADKGVPQHIISSMSSAQLSRIYRMMREYIIPQGYSSDEYLDEIFVSPEVLTLSDEDLKEWIDSGYDPETLAQLLGYAVDSKEKDKRNSLAKNKDQTSIMNIGIL